MVETRGLSAGMKDREHGDRWASGTGILGCLRNGLR